MDKYHKHHSHSGAGSAFSLRTLRKSTLFKLAAAAAILYVGRSIFFSPSTDSSSRLQMLAEEPVSEVVQSPGEYVPDLDILEDMLVDPTSSHGPTPFLQSIRICMWHDDGPSDGTGGDNPSLSVGAHMTAAAEWVRTAFHDAATYNKNDRSGGLDGSVQFEGTREENLSNLKDSGVPFNVEFFRQYMAPGVSLADIIALAAVASVKVCSGPAVPYKYGRVDATAANEPNLVPLETEHVDKQMDKFARMNFTKEEAIAMVACGHTLGRVHHHNKPKLVPSNKYYTGFFDDSYARFDNNIAKNYVNGGGNIVNPLANPDGPRELGAMSDADLFASDKNVTIKRLAKSSTYFAATCQRVFDKMINGMTNFKNPKQKTLQGPIRFRTLRLPYYDWSLDPSSSTLKGYVKYFSSSIPNNEIIRLEIFYTDAKMGKIVKALDLIAGDNWKPPVYSMETTPVWGLTTQIPVSFTFDAAHGVQYVFARSHAADGTVAWSNSSITGKGSYAASIPPLI
ncbi:heme peroxidase [Polychytrium aggregatum]|uniref:heme peroxidase n=1 Tax=Polychytrium aggregatum TaxID=110093 RepID=UPI0022FE89F2|nr:heme peroxidase [Polychytrium aggregatum]KAI9202701.1 heme peroxidase [Polychytrium aggregatum]